MAPVNWTDSITIYVNGKEHVLRNGSVDPKTTLLSYLRNTLGLTGSKLGCGVQ